MNKYCNKISLPYEPLASGYDLFDHTDPINTIDLQFLNPELKHAFFMLGIRVTHIESFYKKSHDTGIIHSDSRGGDFVKINWIYGGEESYMEWFRIYSAPGNPSKRTAINTPFIEYSEQDVISLERHNLSGSYLVQVGIPHRVVNYNQPRHCLCLVLTDLNNRRLSMQTAQEILGSYIY